MASADALKKKLDVLNNKSFSIEEGIELLKQTQAELSISKESMKSWNELDIAMNTILIPLNIIINACELKAANSLYKTLVTKIYANYARSGTRVEGHTAKALSTLKTAMIEALKKKSPDLIPGVNIIVGLAEDSFALYQAIERGNSGEKEAASIKANIKSKLKQAEKQLIKLGIDRSGLYETAGRVGKTA